MNTVTMSETMTKRRGTSLIEVLVVIVVFLVGILAIVQIFPGGFQILNRTRDNAMATQLARDEIERLKGRANQMPDMILPVEYTWTGSDFLLSANPNREPNDLGPVANSLNFDGNLLDGGNNVLGNWAELSGANITRRIVGEASVVPAPRLLDPSDPDSYGGLMVLHFGPVLFNPNYQSLFTVYGNDMYQRDGLPNRPLRPFEYFLDEFDEPTATISLPADRFAARTFRYRMNVTATIQGGSGPETRTFVDVIIPVPADASGVYTLSLSSLIPDFLSCEPASMRIARQYDQVSGAFSTDNPYEYTVVNGVLGTLLFNPAGYDLTIPQPGGRRAPLLARVSYDVLDWRILREDFRISDAIPWQHKMVLQSIKVKGSTGADGKIYNGLPFQVPTDTGDDQIDVVLLDMETGGVYLHNSSNPVDPAPSGDVIGSATTDPTRSSYTVDKSAGRITFNDFDRDPSNGLQLRLILPGGNVTTVDAAGRTVRALYMANNEWAVQAMKAPSSYSQSFGNPGIAQYYVGASTGFGGVGTRIYFPRADLGRAITIDEVYGIKNGVPVGPLSFTGTIRQNPTDPLPLPSVDLSSLVDSLDYRYGQAIRGVKGASVAVRVLHNPQKFSLTNDAAQNLRRFESWMQGWRRSTTETYLQRGDK